MVTLKKIFNPNSYPHFIRDRLQQRRLLLRPNLRGAFLFPPGHFYSPLLDIEQLGPGDSILPFDGFEWWEHINLRSREQRSYYEDLLDRFPPLPFPRRQAKGYRYFTENSFFKLSDAFTLSGIIQREKPQRIVEVGSGFSSAVILDTLELSHRSATLTFIEPYPDRVYSLLLPRDKPNTMVIARQIQEVPLSVFDQLEAQDLLFIDSSHVAKVGSDVAFLLLRVLPRLRPGVLVHFHDIFYPFSYPAEWIRQGRAWNESLFVRAFLVGSPRFELIAFNCYAGYVFPDLFRDRFPDFLDNTGASLWIRKVS